MNFMLERREHQIHIFKPTCNVLFIIWRLNIEYFQFYCVSKYSSFTNTAGLYSEQKIQKLKPNQAKFRELILDLNTEKITDFDLTHQIQ